MQELKYGTEMRKNEKELKWEMEIEEKKVNEMRWEMKVWDKER